MKQLVMLLLPLLLPGSDSSLDDDRLLKHLFDPDHQTHSLKTIPVNSNDDVMNVNMGIAIRKLIALEEAEEVLKIQYYLIYEWVDHRLKWNASSYGNIRTIDVHSSKLWIPTLLLSNNAKVIEPNEITPETNYVQVDSTGACHWYPRYERSIAQCPVDVTWFPFDDQTCQLVFESWLLSNSSLRITTFGESVDLLNFITPDEWRLTAAEGAAGVSVYNTSLYFPTVTFTLHLRRRPLYYVVNLIVPCCLLSLVAVVTFLLPPGCTERLGLGITVLLAMTIYQIIVNSKLPSSSDSVPVIVRYFIFVICFCIAAIVATVVILRMHLRAERTPLIIMPAWMKNLFCERLAPYLRLKPPPSPSRKPSIVHKNSRDVVAAGDMHADTDTGETPCSTDMKDQLLLKRICDLLEARVHKEEEQCREDDKDTEIKNDWMLAAGVLNRIFGIAMAVVFVLGNLSFFIKFAGSVHASRLDD